MELIVIGSNFIKIFMVSLLTYYTYKKITNNKKNDILKDIFIIISCIIITLLYIILIFYFQPLIIFLILFMIYGIIIRLINIENMNYYRFFTYIISCIFGYGIYIISTMISGILLSVIIPNINLKNPISLLIIPTISWILFKVIFGIKRFRNGFNFLKKDENNKKRLLLILFFTGVTILFIGTFQKTNTVVVNTSIFLGIILISITIIIWIKSQITKTYKSNMRDRTIEIQKTEIDEKDKIIEDLKSENLKLATTIHKYNHKFSSLESAMKNAIDIDNKTEFANELSIILKETADTIENFSKEVCVNKNKLPLTNIPGIDNMFKYMQEEAIKNNINFDLKINESINYLVENIIPKEKFEILIGDHLKDAIIAINASDNSYKSILVTLGLVENCYELNIYDTGIEFEIDTLLKLGKEQVTTHKDTGGSGIGFMTTFETLKNCKASLIIEEYKPETTNYTKVVIIRFDNKNEYKIISYRANEIRKFKKGYNMVIQNLI